MEFNLSTCDMLTALRLTVKRMKLTRFSCFKSQVNSFPANALMLDRIGTVTQGGLIINLLIRAFLTNLIIQSRMIDRAATVTIDHNMIFHLRSLFNSVRVFMESAGGKNSSLKESLDHLHNVNHDVISGLLCPNMAERIGIFNETG